MGREAEFNREQIMSAQWQGIGSGSFNQVFLSRRPFTLIIDGKQHTQRWVKKKPLERNLQNDSRRGVRVWNELHHAKPALLNPINQREWIAPYFGSAKANDAKTALAVIDVYQRTGRIVVDACGIGNVMVVKGVPKVVDVDVALAPDSPASKDFAYREIQYNPVQCGYDAFWGGYIDSMPNTVNTIKTLYYLDECLDHDIAVRSLLNHRVINALHPYREGANPISLKLIEQISKTLENAPESVEVETTGYAKMSF